MCRNGILANIPNTDIGDANTDSFQISAYFTDNFHIKIFIYFCLLYLKADTIISAILPMTSNPRAAEHAAVAAGNIQTCELH